MPGSPWLIAQAWLSPSWQMRMPHDTPRGSSSHLWGPSGPGLLGVYAGGPPGEGIRGGATAPQLPVEGT